MKKLLLTLSAAALAVGAMSAEEPGVYPGLGFCGVAPDGSLAISYIYEKVSIVNLATGEQFEYSEDEAVVTGNGNCISNTGVVVGNVGELASYWVDGSWKMLEPVENIMMSKADGITRNGRRIVGAITPENYDGGLDGLMLVPCVWDLQENGNYGECVRLPFPEKDFVGRTPQYITALAVSEDGNTIVGQVQDYSGQIIQPIVYNYADGEWSYTLLLDNLYHPEGFVLPEDPGDGDDVQPETFMSQEEREEYQKAIDEYFDIVWSPEPYVTDFMSEEENADYQAALEEYYASWETDEPLDYPDAQNYMTQESWEAYQNALNEYYNKVNSAVYPNPTDYMTEEELAAYEKAKEASDTWYEKWEEFAMAFGELCEIVPNFTFNNAFLTPDGTKYATTFAKGDFFSGYDNIPYVLDLTDGTVKSYDADHYIISSITDNGTILAQKPVSWENPVAEAYILLPEATAFEPLHSFIASKNASIGEWMTENMTHPYTDYVLDEDTWDYEEVVIDVLATGIPFASADLSVIALTVENFWYDWESSDEEFYPAYGYILQSNSWAGAKAVKYGTLDVKAYKGGVIAFAGEVASATVYDLAGCAVFSVDAPAGAVNTGLGHGIYVVKAVAKDGTVKTAKVAF